MIGSNFEIKIADFGLCNIKNVSNKMNNEFESKTDEYNVGTYGYMAPELIINRNAKLSDEKIDLSDISISKSCDIFSLSIILWQMLNGYNSKPFNKIASKDDKLYSLIIDKNYNKFWEYHKECIFMKYTYERRNIQNLFEQMFEFDPIKRINVNNILKHEFIIDIDIGIDSNNKNNNKFPESYKLFLRNGFIKNKRINKKRCKNYVIHFVVGRGKTAILNRSEMVKNGIMMI